MSPAASPRASAEQTAPRRRAAPLSARWLAGRWLAAGGAVVLAAVVGVALVLQSGAAPACAAPPTGGTVHRGKATFYDAQGPGNCSFAAPADGLFVALGPAEYDGAAACGGYLDVTGPKGTVRVKITDQCPECAPGHLDLSRAAFTRIADPVQGIVPVTYRAAVHAPVPGPLTFRIKEGSSAYWFAVLVDNHADPLRSVEVRGPGGAWQRPVRQDYNYWVADGGLGPGPFSIRVTDVYGRRATATGITMSPGRIQRSDVRMSGAAAPAQPGERSARRPASSARPPASTRRPASSPTPGVRKAGPPAGQPATAGGRPSTAGGEAAPTVEAGTTPLALAAGGDACR